MILWFQCLFPVFSKDGAIFNATPELPDISTESSTKAFHKSKKKKLFSRKMTSGNTAIAFLAGMWRTLLYQQGAIFKDHISILASYKLLHLFKLTLLHNKLKENYHQWKYRYIHFTMVGLFWKNITMQLHENQIRQTLIRVEVILVKNFFESIE